MFNLGGTSLDQQCKFGTPYKDQTQQSYREKGFLIKTLFSISLNLALMLSVILRYFNFHVQLYESPDYLESLYTPAGVSNLLASLGLWATLEEELS